MDKPSLRLFEPVITGSGFDQDLTKKAENWSRSWLHGPWQGSFEMYGDDQVLADFFYSRLGYHVSEKFGGNVTWEGLVYEMDLEIDGSIRRRSYEKLMNAVKAYYIDETNASQATVWYSQAQSIGRYGRREQIESMNGYPAASAQGRAQAVLARQAWPWARQVSISGNIGRPKLTVSVAGYAFTANFKFVSAVDGATGNLSTWIENIAGTDLQFLSIGKIATNTVQVTRLLSVPQRAWDAMMDLAEIGDTSYNPWRLHVTIGRKLVFEQLAVTPQYYWQGKLVNGVGARQEVNPWLVRPAVVRDMSWPVHKTEPGSVFADARDAWIEQVEAGPNGLTLGQPASEYDIAQKQAEFLKRQANEAKNKKGKKNAG